MSDDIYNNEFYDLQSKESYESALVVLALLKKKLGERIPLDSVVDFGCGVGSWLSAAKEVGFNKVCGTDGEYVPKDRLMIDEEEFFSNDLSRPHLLKLPESRYNLAMSLEVAEHLPETSAANFVALLCSVSDIVLFSAAIPYQGGHGHVNENWMEYWAAHFQDHDFYPVDLLRADIWNDERVCWWYKQNCMVFVSKKLLRLLPTNTQINPPLSIIHPEQLLVCEHRANKHETSSLGGDRWYYRQLMSRAKVLPKAYGKEHSID